ncbi:MAG: DUF2089 domain-containing protein [Candidatus Aminicenantes bacterium]|jgi:hypothetical protein
MAKDWQELTKISRGGPLIVERVRLLESDIALEGSFELPPLARLTLEDQIFITAFVRSHGSIKDMEELFGVSYPTVKNRLNRISQQLEFVDINPPLAKGEVLERLEKGELSVDEAVKKLRGDQ